MRGFATFSALALAGCGFSATTTPATQTDAAMPDAKLPDGPADDIDADGIKNPVDNCPSIANSMQFNEDGDARGDECDPCPHLGGAADDVDDDGDKIGNGCDPRRNTPGDALAYWNGFHVAGAGLPDGLTLTHGSAARWSVANGFLVFTRGDSDWGVPAVDVGKTNHTIDALFTITAEFTATTASAAGVAVDIAADDTDLFDCQARTDLQRREMWRRDLAGPGGWTELTASAVTTPLDTYRIVLTRTPTDVPCTTTRQGQVSVSLSNSTDSQSNTRAGLFARNVDARFKYMAVYTSP